MLRSNRLDAHELLLEAFQVDRSWYERHWLEERPQRLPGVVRRTLSHLLRAGRAAFHARHRAGARMALSALPRLSPAQPQRLNRTRPV